MFVCVRLIATYANYSDGAESWDIHFFLSISTDGSHIVDVRKFAVFFLCILITVLDLTNLFFNSPTS